MPRKSKNSTKRNSNQFELLDDEDDGTNDNDQRSRSPSETDTAIRPRTAPITKEIRRPESEIDECRPGANEDSLARIEALLKRVEERAERAEKRVESLEEFIRNELFPRVASPPSPPLEMRLISNSNSTCHLRHHPPVPGPLPGIGLDVSRVLDSDIKEGNAGTIRRRANAALENLGVTCLGVNSKGNGRFRLLFRETDVDKVRQNDTWIRTHFDKGTLYGEQWYPLRVDRAHRGVATDDIGCAVFGRMNGVKVHKMRWLGTASVDKEYRSLVVHLDKKEEVDRLLAKRTVEMANGEASISLLYDLRYRLDQPRAWKEWLVGVFDRFTKAKARNGRDYRLLITDGHSSHINMDFLEWCDQHRIIVAVFPPHSTHRLQPLDVSLFGPLSTAYTNQLIRWMAKTQGLVGLSKREFWTLFWNALEASFSPENIASGWMRTGLLPLDSEVVLSQIVKKEYDDSDAGSDSEDSLALQQPTARELRRLVDKVVDKSTANAEVSAQKLKSTLESLQSEVELLRYENKGLRETIIHEKQRRQRGTALKDYLFDPRKKWLKLE
ncbi:DDE superfamily endonuclease [Hirsutella rhossiliensis]|uniref:DDE superfamily endonuclease domain-containing protein n=1 Tax=Hirsutella rhossiliensis TaxID=111463 RepID=A0A9P8SE14_9HYPO|nr:DDE superfamily endonuclease domain-containing protein [Hirsutella rhossiliensis]KAH0959343.1 DDE superfamily endonuclease domain-containing protein [Hirsutella rhossiliensis]